MQTSPDLPTTVDFGNNLVNYIEVNADNAQAALLAQETQVDTAPPSTSVVETTPEPVAPRGQPALPLDQYRRDLPRYLQDFDQAEDSSAYQYALTAIEKMPPPPTLPGFLGKPILNAAFVLKDDNSVLGMPNHTVLNHLATSSIKNNILAVSATTRYKDKVPPPYISLTRKIWKDVSFLFRGT
jgi:hypothetical protein